MFDWDVHFGDGTAEIVKDDPSVLYISIHWFDQGDFYPGKEGRIDNIGEGKGKGFNINIPFDGEGIEDEEYAHVCNEIVWKVIQSFGPDMIVISCGFDSASEDPLGKFNITEKFYWWAIKKLTEI